MSVHDIVANLKKIKKEIYHLETLLRTASPDQKLSIGYILDSNISSLRSEYDNYWKLYLEENVKNGRCLYSVSFRDIYGNYVREGDKYKHKLFLTLEEAVSWAREESAAMGKNIAVVTHPDKALITDSQVNCIGFSADGTYALY